MVRVARREVLGRGSILVPVLGIVVLLVSYFLIAEWQNLPRMIVSAVHWPLSG
jgi:hypothetical protein